ncbi:MAG: PBP1A family penicillin-binding protein [Gemmatimonadota bacterium]|nr:PBP1A family penicillin-binding protein [Gemmatimonadota bacterium]
MGSESGKHPEDNGAPSPVRRAVGLVRGWRPSRRAWGWAAAGLVAAGAAGAGFAWGAWSHICADCPSIAQIYAFEPKEATRVYAADGTLLREFAVERRTAVPFARIPRHVVDAFIAVEDRRFLEHEGIDIPRTVRAALEFAVAGYDAAGASTITQQLAGNMFRQTVNRQVISVRRKLREMQVARSLERAFTKEEILEAYLNQINFDGVYGVENAARHYFGRGVEDLNLPEAATLAAIPKNPGRYSPLKHPEQALARRNLVLELMERQGRIGPEAAAAARAYPLLLRARDRDGPLAPYFVEWVRRILIERYGTRIYEDGLRIYTSLDPVLQAAADSALREQMAWIESQPGYRAPTYEETRAWPEDRLAGPNMPYVQGMFVAVDPTDGDVLAYVGGRDFEDSEFDRALQARRQAGSAFKPFVYAAALASGIPASEVIFDTPVEFPQPDSTIWSPSNFTNDFRGPMTLRDALTQSVNVVAVKLGQRVGIESVAQYAHRMGITTPIDRVPSTAIGSASVRPLELVEAYTTFANLGVRVSPRPILRVENSAGEVIWEPPVEREEVLDERTSYILVSMMRDVVDRGSGIRVRALGVPRDIPVAGKTGTTNELTNAWFLGFTPDIVTAAWVGFDLPARIRRDAQGGRDAAPMNARVLKSYYARHPAPRPWLEPDGIVDRLVDRTTGLLANEWCPPELVYREVYIAGTEPRESCDVHGAWGAREPRDDLLPGEPPEEPADSGDVPIGETFEF